MNEHTRSLARAIGLSVARRYPVTRDGAQEIEPMNESQAMSVRDACAALGIAPDDRRFGTACERAAGRGADVDPTDPEIVQAAIASATRPDDADARADRRRLLDGRRYRHEVASES